MLASCVFRDVWSCCDVARLLLEAVLPATVNPIRIFKLLNQQEVGCFDPVSTLWDILRWNIFNCTCTWTSFSACTCMYSCVYVQMAMKIHCMFLHPHAHDFILPNTRTCMQSLAVSKTQHCTGRFMVFSSVDFPEVVFSIFVKPRNPHHCSRLIIMTTSDTASSF